MTTPTWVNPTAPSGAGPVTLTMPANPAMVRVGRLTASSVASLADLSIDDIDDIKIAVSEVVTLLIEQGDGPTVVLSFDATSESFVIEGSAAASHLDLGREVVALTAAVLGAVCDHHEFSFADGRIGVVVRKSSSPVPVEG